MSTFNLNKPVLVNTADHLDATFEVADNTERDILITNRKVSEGHILYHKGDNKHYILKTYDGSGNVANATWNELGSGGGGNGGGAFDQELFFIDSNVTTGTGEVGNKEKPFKEVKEAISFLRNNNQTKTFVFIGDNTVDNTGANNFPLYHYRFISLNGNLTIKGDNASFYDNSFSTILGDNGDSLRLEFQCNNRNLNFNQTAINYGNGLIILNIRAEYLLAGETDWLSDLEQFNIKVHRASFESFYNSTQPFYMSGDSFLSIQYLASDYGLFNEAILKTISTITPRLKIELGDIESLENIKIHDKTNCYVDIHFKGKLNDGGNGVVQTLSDATSSQIPDTPAGLVSWFMYNTEFDGDFAFKGSADIYGSLKLLNNNVTGGVFTAVTGLNIGMRFFDGTLYYGGQEDLFKSHHKKRYTFTNFSCTYDGTNGSFFNKSTNNKYEVPFAEFFGNCVFNHQGNSKHILNDGVTDSEPYVQLKGNLGGNVLLSNSNGGADVTVFSNGVSKADVTDKGISVEDENGIEQFKLDKNESIKFVGATFPNNSQKEVAFSGGGGGNTKWVYVNTENGNDVSGDGSQGNPYLTLQKAIDEANQFLHVIVTNSGTTWSGSTQQVTDLNSLNFLRIKTDDRINFVNNLNEKTTFYSIIIETLSGSITMPSRIEIEQTFISTNAIFELIDMNTRFWGQCSRITCIGGTFEHYITFNVNALLPTFIKVYGARKYEISLGANSGGGGGLDIPVLHKIQYIDTQEFSIYSAGAIRDCPFEYDFSGTVSESSEKIVIKADTMYLEGNNQSLSPTNLFMGDFIFKVSNFRDNNSQNNIVYSRIHDAEFIDCKINTCNNLGFSVYQNCQIGMMTLEGDIKPTHVFKNNSFSLSKRFTDLLEKSGHNFRGMNNDLQGISTFTENHFSDLKFSGLALLDCKIYTNGAKLIEVDESGISEDYNLAIFLGSNIIETGTSKSKADNIVDITNKSANDTNVVFLGNNLTKGHVQTTTNQITKVDLTNDFNLNH